jgi:acetyltransferase-like isoleucine patch superfamily enzyme
MNSFYSNEELSNLGLKKFGHKVYISRFAHLYSPESISIGDNVRIDDFCILSGNINIGSNIHISAYVALFGAKGIILEDYTGISPRCSLFSAMDDFSGNYLIGPIHPCELTNVTGGIIILKQYSQIGAHSVIFPDITIGEGTVVGACSLVTKSLEGWGVFAGIPAKWIKPRDRKINKIHY